ncbi:MAG: DNA repair protein RecN [Clostridia bacterium]|nr:DNA repair protein RecN [Clostridia bacterium]
MLEQLTIKNVAVIDRLEAELGGGMSVLTGETGAGKSIIIDSINMILGSRASKELVRRGADKAEVQAVFSMPDGVRAMLDKNGIDTEDGEVIISRRLTAEGKSTARINGTIVTLAVLRDVADMLINIHGQHDNQALLNPSRHIDFLDAYAHTETELNAYHELYSRAREISRRLKALDTDEQERLRRADLLSYQINEIKAAELSLNEEDELSAQRRLLENAVQISENANRAYAVLYDMAEGQSAYDLISEAAEAVGEIADMSPELAAVYESINSAMYAIEDAAREVRDFGERTEADPKALDEVNERLDLINRLKRKYGGTVEEVIAFGERAERELDEIVMSDEAAEALHTELEAVKKKLRSAADALGKKRETSARALSLEIEKALHELNMEKARFMVAITPQKFTPSGTDSVEFMIATNPGEELKPLIKIASGGELSRVMLAIKSILAGSDDVETLIFDEIDTGVSGSAAQKIADKLRGIAATRQVICITHLPQIAGAADNHFLIEKNIEGDIASTSLIPLDHEGRVAELARIVGGGKAGEDYAEEMLKNLS